MRYDLIHPGTLRLWKKRLLVGGAVLLGLGIAGCGAGAFGLYSLGKHVTASVGAEALGPMLPKPAEITLGPVTGTIVTVASDWAAWSIARGEAQSVKHGLACLDALGGPDAARFLDTLASKATSADAAKAIRRVSAELSKEGESRPASCIAIFAG